MFQKGSYDFECQLATHIAAESLEKGERHSLSELDAHQETTAARKEQQRFNILRYLRSH